MGVLIDHKLIVGASLAQVLEQESLHPIQHKFPLFGSIRPAPSISEGGRLRVLRAKLSGGSLC